MSQVGDGVFEVLSTSGDTHLGGNDFDKRIVGWLAESFKRDEGAKIELSSLTQTNISLPFITVTSDGPKHIDTTLTRVVITGGSGFKGCTVVQFRSPIKKITGKDPNMTVNPDEMVAVGWRCQAPWLYTKS
uniref:Uncharacterized protein n=1 Tax=Cucumis sativus TaxID=3659 RepID=A0A0A0L3E9_CUCSA